jgi:hypothetical protein
LCSRSTTGFRLQLDRDDPLDLEVVVMAGRVQLRPQVQHQMRVGHVRQFGGFVIRPERLQHVFGVVREVENVGRVLSRIGPV